VPCYYIVISGRSQGNKPSPTNATQEGRGLSSRRVSCLAYWKDEGLVTSPTQSCAQGI